MGWNTPATTSSADAIGENQRCAECSHRPAGQPGAAGGRGPSALLRPSPSRVRDYGFIGVGDGPMSGLMTLDLHHEFTLNPDGSGRAALRWTGPVDEGVPPPDEFVRAEIERAQGVEAWADVRCAVEGDHTVFTATAWFRDLGALRFHCQGVHVNLVDLELVDGDDGSVEIRTRLERSATGDPTTGDDPATNIEAERDKLRSAREFVAGMFGGLTCTIVVNLPGRLVGKLQGKRRGDTRVETTFHGARLVALLDRLLTDDALMARLLASGGLNGPSALIELLGDDVLIGAKTAPRAQPQFDFEQEVSVARQAFAEFAASLRVASPDAGPATPLDNVRIVAARVVHEADSERDLCPQGQSTRGITLTIAADLPSRALALDRALLERVITDDGADITPADEWDRQCHFPKATADGSTIYLDFALPAGHDARGLAELSARVTATTSLGSEEVELGFPAIEAGAHGSQAGAELLRVESEPDGGTLLELRLGVQRHHILGASLLLGDGRSALTIQGWSSCNDECTVTCHIDGPVPAGARIAVTLATGLERADYALALQGVDWFGRAIARDS